MVSKMKKILYTTDFSKNAENAFNFALKMAEKQGAELIMLHVFNDPTVWTYPYTKDPFEIRRQATKAWKKTLQELFEQYKTDVKVKYVAIENPSVVKGILSVIKKYNPGLIIAGIRGKSKIKEVIMGSTTRALIQQSPAPVLAIPENAHYRDFKNILYTSDYQESDIKAIEQLIDLVKDYEPEINAIHVSTYKEFLGDQKMEWFKDLVNEKIGDKRITFELLLSDNIFEKLNDYMNENEFDMLVMLEKERFGFMDKWFHDDLVRKMEFRTSIPLLSYNEQFLRVRDSENVETGRRMEQEH
jgi:nucleotide-binding universal stress UspA family protein